MKKRFLILLFVINTFFTFGTNAEDLIIRKDKDAPAGMEVIKIGDGQEILVPEGTKTRRIGAQLILEDTSAYFAKKFIEIEDHFREIEVSLQQLGQKIGDLEEKVQQQND